MAGLVALPQGSGWHFVDLSAILAVKHMAPGKTVVFPEGGLQLDVSEDSHVVHRRIRDFLKLGAG